MDESINISLGSQDLGRYSNTKEFAPSEGANSFLLEYFPKLIR